MTNQEFIGNTWSVTLTVILCAIASYWCWIGAMRGMMAHRVPRVVLSCGITAITTGFASSLFFDYYSAASISRVGLWITAIGLAWSSITGIRAGQVMRDAETRLDRLEEVIERIHDRPDDGG